MDKPAFPIDTNHPAGQTFWRQGGMSIRQVYKAAALQGFMSAMAQQGRISPENLDIPWVASICGTYADAMLAEDESHEKGKIK